MFMKTKSVFFTLFVLMFGLCGILTYYNSTSFYVANAVSQNVSVWDGEYISKETDLAPSDWYNQNGSQYYIRSAKGLSYFAYSVNEDKNSFKNKQVYLETDIDLDGFEWTPIGNDSIKFQGRFYGQGYSIYNMYISAESPEVGFFGVLEGYSRIENLHIKNATIDLNITSNSPTYVGVLVGNFNNTEDLNYNNTRIETCSATGTISLSAIVGEIFVGGLVGNSQGTNIISSRSEVNFNLGSENDSMQCSTLKVGGITAESNSTTIRDSFFVGDLGEIYCQCSNLFVGSVVGESKGNSTRKTSISNVYAMGNFEFSCTENSSIIKVGGLVGSVSDGYIDLKNTFYIGDISSSIKSDNDNCYLGGLVGYLKPVNSQNTVLQDSFYVGKLTSNANNKVSNLYVIDSNQSGNLNAVGLYYNVDAVSNDLEHQIVNLDSLAKTKDFYENERYWSSVDSWQFNGSSSITGWEISSGINRGYPYLVASQNIGNANNDEDYSNSSSGLAGKGTADDPYLIKTAGDLGYLSFNLKKNTSGATYYSLQNDIDLSGKTWKPIGTNDEKFSGVFDGNGYTIYGMTCSLQEQFGYHGLFGVTQNAVIKNLSIKNINYLNEGTTSGKSYIGTLVGYAYEDTYIINCTDNEYGQPGTMNGNKKVYTVGAVGENAHVYVFYGSKSINIEGDLIANGGFYGNIDLTGLSNVYYGFDVTVDTNGGSVYNENKDIYRGTYQILLMAKEEGKRNSNLSVNDGAYDVVVLGASENNSSFMDTTFGTSLPQLSHLYGKSDVVIKKGFKATEYKYYSGETMFTLLDNGTNTTSFTIDPSKRVLQGLFVSYEEYSNKEITVHYNAYEKEKFDLSSFDYENGLFVDENGLVNKTFELEYDAFLSENEEMFNIPTYILNGRTTLLRNGLFDIDDFYREFDESRADSGKFVDAVDRAGTLANSQISELYVKWKGKELDDNLTLTINFEKAEGTAGMFNLQDAISTFKIKFEGDVDEEKVLTGSVSDGNAVLTEFNTLYSDDGNKYISVEVELNSGYEFIQQNILDGNYNSTIDTNFGTLKFDNSTMGGETTFYNLLNDFSMTIFIGRIARSTSVNIDENVYIGLTPMVSNWTNVSIMYKTSGSNFLSSLTGKDSYNATINTIPENKFVGYDVSRGSLLTTNTVFDSFTIPDEYKLNGSDIILKYDFQDGSSEYYVYSRTAEDADNFICKLSKITTFTNISNYEVGEEIAWLEYVNGSVVLHFYSHTSFGIIFSTETGPIGFSKYTQNFSQPNSKTRVILQNETEDENKIVMTFNDVVEISEALNATTTYTKAVFDFKTKYLNADGTLVDITQNAPILSMNSVGVGVTSDGSFEVSLTSTDYYRFFANIDNHLVNNPATGELIIYNGNDSGYNVKMTVSNSNVGGIWENSEAYERQFNSNNRSFLSNSRLTVEQVNDKDVYKITFNFNASDQSGTGLQSGYYLVEFVCTDVLYEIEYANRFIDYGENVEEGNLEEETLDYISTVGYVNGGTYANDLSIKFGDEITVETYMTENFAYNLWGWLVKGYNYSEFVERQGSYAVPTQDNKEVFDFMFKDRYRGVGGIAGSEYKIIIYAVYQRKQVSLTLSNQIIVYEPNGNDGENVSQLGGVSVAISKWTNNRYVYNYNSNNPYDNQLAFSFSLSGNNVSGYYVSGYRIVDSQNNLLASESVSQKGSIINNFDLNDFISKTLTAEGSSLLTNYTIIPILRQRTATVYLYSGTGIDSTYGDKKDGHVFDVNGNQTTDSVVKIENLYFGGILYLDSSCIGCLNGSDVAEVINPFTLFNNRTGYTRSVWQSSVSKLDLSAAVSFESFYFSSNGEANQEIVFYLTWDPISYLITFNGNGGRVDGKEEISLNIKYDSETFTYNSFSCTIETLSTIVKNVEYQGYELAGWGTNLQNLENSLVFDKSFNLTSNQLMFDLNGNYVYDNNIILYALWEENSYTVRLMLNGANSYQISEQETVDIAYAQQKDFYIDVKIKYQSSFGQIFLDDDQQTFSLSNLQLNRQLFVFKSFYAQEGNDQLMIGDSTIFTTDIPSCSSDLSGEVVLTLYAAWEFDGSAVSLDLHSNSLNDLIYNATQQKVYLSQYFASGYDVLGYVVSLDPDGENMDISIPQNANAHVEIELSSSSATISDQQGLSFSVRNAGDYQILLTITVVDDVNYFNIQNAYITELNLNVSVKKTTVSVSLTEQTYLKNVTRIMSAFVSNKEREEINNLNSLDELTNYMKNIDSGIVDGIGEQINLRVYQYLMYKYYMMTESNGYNYTIYKDWNFANFEEYIADEQNLLAVESTVESLKYFAYYDYLFTEDYLPVDGYENLSIISSEVSSVELEVEISEIKLIKNITGDFTPRNLYQMIIYLDNVVASSDSLKNYEVLYDEDNRAYIIGEMAYLMPQIIEVENLSTSKNSYFNSAAASVSWEGERESIVYNEQTYYKLSDNLYLSTDIYTSNEGQATVDTEYSFTSEDNYLYFTNSVFLIKQGETYVEASTRFAPVMNEADLFTILNTNGIIRITANATYLTDDGDSIYFETVLDDMYTEILRITTIEYNISGTIGEVSNSAGLTEETYSVDGVVIYQISSNSANSVSIFLTSAVTKVVMTTTTLELNEFISFYRWSDAPRYSIEDVSQDSTIISTANIDIDITSIDLADYGITELTYYAIYTDLVRVEYDLNLPDSYATTSATVYTIKLGETTAQDLIMPTEKGFILSTLKAQTPYGELIDYTEMFVGEDKGRGATYVGITPETKHSTIHLVATWAVERISYIQKITEYNVAVNTFNYLLVDDVALISNLNSSIYTYDYAWYFEDSQVSIGQTLRLKENGSSRESGNYKLIITATLQPTYVSALENQEETSTQVEISFSLNFMKNIVQDVSMDEETATSIIYDSNEHLNDWTINVDYTTYNNLTNQYGSDRFTLRLNYITTGSIYFLVYFNGGGQVYSMKNAGKYRIQVCFDESVYDISGIGQDKLEYIYTISPFSMDLKDQEFVMGKEFNAQETMLTQDVVLGVGNASLQLTRDSGEDLGDYNLYFADVLQENKENYSFSYNGVVLFEGGQTTAAASQTPIGTFTISKASTLRLSYVSTTENPMAIVADYDSQGYSLNLTNNLGMKILKGSEVYKDFALTLYDVGAKANITNLDVLAILQTKFADLTPYFFNTTNLTTVYDGLVYTYTFELGSEFGKYYNTVEFASGYTFEINSIKVSVADFNLDKTYDGEEIKYLNLDGEEIDLADYSGVYIAANYSSVHAGENIKVDLSLQRTNDENLSNYSLSENYVYASIKRLSATMSFELSKTSFTYGEVAISDISNLISSYTILDGNNQNVNDLLVSGFYTLTYSLPSATAKNSRGYIYVGHYSIEVEATFQDFEMQIDTSSLSFDIVALKYDKEIPQSYITISVLDTVKDVYTEQISVPATGDNLMLEYRVSGLVAGEKPSSVGLFDLSLVQNTFAMGSIIVNLNSGNKGFEVLYETGTLYVRLLDADNVLIKTYNGKNYSLQSDTNKTFSIVGETTEVVGIEFFVKDQDTGVENVISNDGLTFNTFNISTITNPISDAGSYKLNLTADCVQYTNVVFAEEYFFEIMKVSIALDQFENITRVYNGNKNFVIDEFNEKISGDVVNILAQFDSATAGSNKTVSLFLSGADMNNYELQSPATVSGEILKANAEVNLTASASTYGQITNSTPLSFTVTSGGVNVASSQYSLVLEIEDASYSETGYLNVGTYTVNLASFSSTNYALTLNTTQIIVNKYVVNMTFNIDGQIAYEYGSVEAESSKFVYEYMTNLYENIEIELTREEGTNVGFYQILSGSTSNGNYSVNVQDESNLGAFQITQAKQRIYLLLSDEETITDAKVGSTATIEYDGNLYDQVAVQSNGVGHYQLVFTSSENPSAFKNFELNYYTLDSDTGTYTKTDTTIDGLTGTIKFLYPDSVKNVGSYQMYASGTASTSNDVKLGKDTDIYCYTLNIIQKQLYFLQSEFRKDFDNQEARFVYDAKEILDGVVEDEDLKITITLKDGENVALYAGINYDVEVEFTGATISNYNLNLTTLDGTALSGMIDKAGMTMIVNAQSYVYGETITLFYTYQTEVDLNGYDTSRFSFELSVVAQDENYSTSGFLRVGEYDLMPKFVANDFRIDGYVVDNVQTDTLTAKLMISPRQLTMIQKDLPLQEIFTKTYDETSAVEIYDDGGELLFNLSGIKVNDAMVSDDVKIASAVYASQYVGKSIQINFVLSGADSGNYEVSPWLYGIINPILVNLHFDYRAEEDTITSNVVDNGLTELSQLAFPFMSTTYLTANSSSSSTSSIKNFPTSLTGKEGYAFLHWTMEFEGVVDNSTEFNYLENLTSSYKLTTAYENETYSVVVGNNEATVKFINSLLTDPTDLFGLYYKTNYDDVSGINITFYANWDVNQYRITILIADRTGSSAQYGQVEVDDGIEATENPIVTTNYLGNFAYQSALTLRAKANEHCYFVGFYNADGTLYTSGEENIEITREGDVDIFKITSITKAYNLVIRFSTQQVNVVYNLSGADGAQINSQDFVELSSGKYQWSTDYLTVQNMTIADLPSITRTGYEVVSLEIDGSSIHVDNFDSTTLISLIKNTSSQSVVLEFSPVFEAIGVEVILDYGYDGIMENIVVPYNQPYNSSAQWNENPLREGYDFVGWFNGDVLVSGDDVVLSTESHSLLAHWQIGLFRLELVVENAVLSDSSLEFVSTGTSYVAENVEYQSTITFKVIPNLGYEVADTWNDNFVVVVNDDKSANIIFTMPSDDYTYTIPIVATQNTISFSGENLQEIKAYILENEAENELVVEDNKVMVDTAKTLKIVVKAQTGYEMLTDVIIQGGDDGVEIQTSLVEEDLIVILSGINSDLNLTFSTTVRRNKITISFDDLSIIKTIEVDGRIYSDIEQLPQFEVDTNDSFVFYVLFNHGYTYDSFVCEQFAVQVEYISEGVYNGYYMFTLTDILSDGQILISSKLATFRLTIEVISYDENKQVVEVADNIALANGRTYVDETYESVVYLTYQIADLYTFAGWSKDGSTIFSTQGQLTYTITQDETIYAIFSALRFDITFATYNYYTVYSEYGAEREQEIYTEISSRYFDGQTGEEIYGIELYYGSNKIITYEVPDGYMYYGYGYKNGNEFIYLEIAENTEREVSINVSSLELNENNSNVTIYMVVKSYNLTVEFESKIDIDGVREDDVDVGFINMTDFNGNGVNQYGYIDGTRIHYLESDFADGNVLNNKHFNVVAYTGDVIYIQAKVVKEGYKFLSIASNQQDVIVSVLRQTETEVFFSLSNLIGGTQGLYIEILFKPVVNVINLSFVDNGVKVDGGSFSFNISEQNKIKVWTSGREYSSVVVSAYTDSDFEVVALIRAGFYVNSFDLESRIGDSSNIIEAGSLTYENLSLIDYGYTGMIKFKVSGYLGVSNITITVSPLTYTVNLMEGDGLLATIDNVVFNSTINLSEENSSNITIVDERIYFQNGKLRVAIPLADYNFEGYFSYQNGAGVRYIDSNGNAVETWKESGYVFNNLTSKYELSSNAYVDPLTGKTNINLYIYWSYNKTRISFEFVPGFRTNTTAQDMITGIDYTNSWFYETSPLYIEISFNTDIRILAPEVQGYRFYKFVISQRTANGTWLSDVVSYSNEIPWSTNEYDRVVECRIQVIYFAHVEVSVFGGEGTYTMHQDGNDTQANILVNQGYVDTQKSFQIVATPEKGYKFLRWINMTTGQSLVNNPLTLQISSATNLMINLQGETVVLNFNYDTSYGQISAMDVQSLDNSLSVVRLGEYAADNYKVNVQVGDTLKFMVLTDFGFGITWNRNDILFDHYSGGIYYFTMKVSPDDAGSTLDITPTFVDEILAVYITKQFVEEDVQDNSTDANNVNLAGKITYNGQEMNFVSYELGQEIRLVSSTNDRYEIDSIVINNYDNSFTDMSEFFTEEGVIVLTPEYLESKNIVGTIEIAVSYRRSLWEDNTITNLFEGDGSADNPFKISSADDLALMMKLVNSGAKTSDGRNYAECRYILTADLQLDEKFWTPIGTEENKFNGYFNFNDHTITGIYTAYFYSPVSYNGLFGILGEDAKIVENEVSIWYVYLIVGLLILMLVLLIVLLLVNKKRKKRREQLAKK